MDEAVKKAIIKQVSEEPFGKIFRFELLELDLGYSKVAMRLTQDMENIFAMVHGGAVFALIDEAFQTACNSHGTVAVALNITVNYVAPAYPGATLVAEAKEVGLTRKTGTYEIKVTDEKGKLIATCQALAYRKGTPLPFLEETEHARH